MRGLLWLGIFGACDSKPAVPTTTVGSGAAPSPEAAAVECTDLPFAPTTPVPEASGAAWLDAGGKPALLVISDSGNKGKYAIVDAGDGTTIEQGTLELGDGGDDLEGIAVRGGAFHVISSPGWVRSYARSDKGFTLATPPYALGPVDIDDKGGGMGDKPPKGSGMVCAAKHVNCGRNYEGLCLAPEPVDPKSRCVGFAAAKADGHLYCVVDKDGKLAVEYHNAIRIARPGVLADCAFADDGALYGGSNLFDIGNVYRVENWQDPTEAKVALVAAMAVGFPETLAVKDDVFYRMSDTGGGSAPSMMRKLQCKR